MTIRIDEPSAVGTAAKRRPAYLSPATQSIAISVNGGTPITQSLTPSGGNCATPSFGATPVCTLVASAPAGSDTFTFITYDGPNATGNKLSQNTVVQTIVAGQPNTVSVILEGVPTGVLVSAFPNQANVLVQGTSFTLVGTSPANFAVEALDADNNFIIGPGAPTLVVTSNSPNLRVAPVTNNPNEFALTPVSDGSTVTLNVVVTGGNGGTATSAVSITLSASVPTPTPTPTPLSTTAPVEVAVSSIQSGSVDIFSPTANGTTPPIAMIATSDGGTAAGTGMAFDATGNLYVAHIVPAQIMEFAPGANGNATPIRNITGAATGLAVVYGVALDPAGDIVVVNAEPGAQPVEIFAPSAQGNVAPTHIIGGAATGLLGSSAFTPEAVAVDASGNIYVAASGSGGGEIAVFAAGVYGNVAPARTITGASTGISDPLGIAVNASGQVYVSNNKSNTVTIYAAGASGNVAPTGGFTTPTTNLAMLALDQLGNIYLVDQSGGVAGRYLVFGPNNFLVGTPIYIVAGDADRFSQTYGIAVH